MTRFEIPKQVLERLFIVDLEQCCMPPFLTIAFLYQQLGPTSNLKQLPQKQVTAAKKLIAMGENTSYVFGDLFKRLPKTYALTLIQWQRGTTLAHKLLYVVGIAYTKPQNIGLISHHILHMKQKGCKELEPRGIYELIAMSHY
jgi:hypothetical protein